MRETGGRPESGRHQQALPKPKHIFNRMKPSVSVKYVANDCRMYVCIKCKLSFSPGTQQIDSDTANQPERREEEQTGRKRKGYRGE